MKPAVILFSLLFSTIVQAQDQSYKNSSLPIEERVEDLLSLMTLEEKVGQLVQVYFGGNLTGPSVYQSDDDKKENMKNGKIGALINVVFAQDTYLAQQLAVENSRLGIPMLFGFDVIHGHQTMFPIPLGLSATWDEDAMELSAKIAARAAYRSLK